MSAVDILSNPITLGTLITLIGSLIAILTYMKNKNDANNTVQIKQENRITCLEQRKDFSYDIALINEKISELSEKVIKMETKHDIIWASLEPSIINVLHHPDPEYYKRDKLLEKFQTKKINEEELSILKNMLGCELNKPNDSKEYMAASLMIARIKSMLMDIVI